MIRVRVPCVIPWTSDYCSRRGSVGVASCVDFGCDNVFSASFDPSLSSPTLDGETPFLSSVFVGVLSSLSCLGYKVERGYRVEVSLAPGVGEGGLAGTSTLVAGFSSLLLRLHGAFLPPVLLLRVCRLVEADVTGDASATGLCLSALCCGGTVAYRKETEGEDPFLLPVPPPLQEGHVLLASKKEEGNVPRHHSHLAVLDLLCGSLVSELHERGGGEEAKSILGRMNPLLLEMGLGWESFPPQEGWGRVLLLGNGKGGSLLCIDPPPSSASQKGSLLPFKARSAGIKIEDGRLVKTGNCDGHSLPPDVVGIASSIGRKLEVGDAAEAETESNIAITKYWGKEEGMVQVACNRSVSLTIPGCVTRTVVDVTSDPVGEDEFVDGKVDSLVRSVTASLLPPGTRVRVRTENSFPSACGVASSASGFAALSLCLSRLVGVWKEERGKYWVDQVARTGSGSAIRSVLPSKNGKMRLVEWEGTRSVDHGEEAASDLSHVLVVFYPFPKKTSSSSAHQICRTSPFFRLRVEAAEDRTPLAIRAVKERDFPLLSSICESEAHFLHCVAMTADPPVRYMGGDSFSLLSKLHSYRRRTGADVTYTVDAGENVHLLCLGEEGPIHVKSLLREAKHMYSMRDGKKEHRYTCILFSGKRFSGKTTLCEEVEKRLKERGVKTRSYAISEAVKRMYWDETVGGEWEERRDAKEEHRERMIAFMEKKREGDPYFWCRMAWEKVEEEPHVILVSDARRKEDLRFFKEATKCVSVRIEATREERQERGWKQTPNIDDAASETGLDDSHFDLTLTTNEIQKMAEDVIMKSNDISF